MAKQPNQKQQQQQQQKQQQKQQQQQEAPAMSATQNSGNVEEQGTDRQP